MQKKNKKIIKFIMAIGIIIILLLLTIILTNLSNKQNKLALNENTPTMLVSSNPNPPKLSAGMIPIKWDGEQWVIVSKNDEEWYNSQPAYIMLNDGYYRSELERGVKEEQLIQNNVGNDALVVPGVENNNPSIFMWVPRFVYNEKGEIGYIKEETTPGEGWILPDIFTYKTEDETKPDFSLSGVWVQKEVDTNYASKISQMNQEESIYGFLANTVGVDASVDPSYTAAIQKYIQNPQSANADSSLKQGSQAGNDLPPLSKGGGTAVPEGSILTDLTNPNRIILKIINNNQHEPIKANITHNTVDKKIEIKVTYTKNGIREVLDEYGDQLELTIREKIILAKTKYALASGEYKFTIIDNKGNKQELSITISVDSFYKVDYAEGIDNIGNIDTYIKTQEEKTIDEDQIIAQLDEKNNYSRAISSGINYITAINEKSRTSEDNQYFIYNRYYCDKHCTYSYTEESSYTCATRIDSKFNRYPQAYRNMYFDETTGVVSLTSRTNITSGIGYSLDAPPETGTTSSPITMTATSKPGDTFYKHSFIEKKYEKNDRFVSGACYAYYYTCTPYIVSLDEEYYAKGDFDSYVVGNYDSFEDNKADENNEWWYTRGDIIPKYMIHKYTSDLILLSTYNVDSKILTTAPIDISNKGRNKLKFTLTATGNDYKTYISNDNTNWQEVIDIASNTPKELSVDGWDTLYIKIETNTSTINNIDLVYYKD